MPLLVLVAEDDLGTRVSIQDYLQQLGYTVVTAADGQQALDALNRFHPQLVITDVKMPKLDGYSLIRQIRQEPTLRLLPVIFLTARDAMRERIR
ncbi:MAG: response regulator, partial [Cyanobacteria bacterium P01_H01_bin.121]